MSNYTINIKGIDEVVLLKNLWQNQVVAGFFMDYPQLAPQFKETEAKKSSRVYRLFLWSSD